MRRALAKHYRAGHTGSLDPSWLTVFAQTKDSLWSVDLFRCESILSAWAITHVARREPNV